MEEEKDYKEVLLEEVNRLNQRIDTAKKVLTLKEHDGWKILFDLITKEIVEIREGWIMIEDDKFPASRARVNGMNLVLGMVDIYGEDLKQAEERLAEVTAEIKEMEGASNE